MDETEYRVIWQSVANKCSALDVEIPLQAIERITLSPWIHSSLSDDLRDVLRGIRGCSEIKFLRSTLINNDEWLTHGEEATERPR